MSLKKNYGDERQLLSANFAGEGTTVKPQLSGLVGTGLNSQENQTIVRIIENMNANEQDDLMSGY